MRLRLFFLLIPFFIFSQNINWESREDLNTENPDAYQIITAPADFDTVRSYLEENGVAMLSAEVIWNPQNRIEIDNYKKAEQVIKLIDLLEEDDDVNSVHSNFDISESVMAELG